jgi:cyanophycin synthetase
LPGKPGGIKVSSAEATLEVSGIQEQPSVKPVSRVVFMLRWRLTRLARRCGFSPTVPLSIPAAFITGSVGKTTTCRMLAAILTRDGRVVGLSTSQGVYVGQDTLKTGDSSSCKYAYRTLVDGRAQVGVFELARGGLLEEGLVFSRCEVGAVLNIYDNHLGLGGVHTREDMARLKSKVVRSARGMAVLNADDPLCLAMRDGVTAATTCLVSMRPDNPAVADHLNAGGLAVFLSAAEEAAIRLYKGHELLGTVPGADIPASYGGHFRPILCNAMFAMALAYGMGVEFAVIRDALGAFQSTDRTNPGRMNFYDHLPFKVLITWAGCSQALDELARFIEGMGVGGKKYLMFCAIGNRPDPFIREMGKSVAGIFTHYICSDHTDLRGRRSCEAAALLRDGLLENGVGAESITLASSHQNGLETALGMPAAGDLLVICTYAFAAARKEVSSRPQVQVSAGGPGRVPG